MPKSMRDQLTEALRSAGHPLIELPGTDGGSALLLPYGGKVLGLFPADEGGSCFWINPGLLEAESARELLQTTSWVMTGGDRTWLAPEAEFFVGDLSDPWGTYEVPLSVDPGAYSVDQSAGKIVASNQARVSNHHRKTYCDVEIEKVIGMIPNPLRREAPAQDWLAEVAYVGYEQTTALRLLAAPDPELRVGIWNIIVLPATGDLIIPTLGRAEVRDCFDRTGPKSVGVTDHRVQFRIDGKEVRKIGIKAASLIGRAGYLRKLANAQWNLVVRSFQVNPSGEYIDVPWDDPDDLGYAFQAYNDGGTLGAFGEMEYHTPAIGGATGSDFYADRSQVWAFTGEKARVFAIAEQLLGQDAVNI